MTGKLIPDVIGPPYDLESLANSVINSGYPGVENIVRDQLPPDVDSQFGIILRLKRAGENKSNGVPTYRKGPPLASIDQWFNS